jgi:radical SAM protein with 4Fe4S-binding SPASM domain
MGEPLGHPQFPELIALCAEAGTPVNLSTNGLLLRGPIAEAAIHPIVRQLNISVHSYLDNFPDADPAPYIEKISRFLDRAEAQRPDLYVNLRLWDMTEGQPVSAAGGILRDHLGRRFGVDLARAPIDLRRRKNVTLRGRISVHFDSRFVWPSLDLPVRTSKGTCMGLRNHFGIHADGTVVPCCLDKEAVIRLGNVQDQGLKDILGSSRAEQMREGFERHELREELCQKCSFISRFDRKTK